MLLTLVSAGLDPGRQLHNLFGFKIQSQTTLHRDGAHFTGESFLKKYYKIFWYIEKKYYLCINNLKQTI